MQLFWESDCDNLSWEWQNFLCVWKKILKIYSDVGQRKLLEIASISQTYITQSERHISTDEGSSAGCECSDSHLADDHTCNVNSEHFPGVDLLPNKP